jgi:hypothetical protein
LTRGANTEGVTTAVNLVDEEDSNDDDDGSKAPSLVDSDSSDDEDDDDDDEREEEEEQYEGYESEQGGRRGNPRESARDITTHGRDSTERGGTTREGAPI